MDIQFLNTLVKNVKSIHYTENNTLIISGDYKQIYISLTNVQEETINELTKYLIEGYQGVYDIVIFNEIAEDLGIEYTVSILNESQPIAIYYKSMMGIDLYRGSMLLEVEGELTNIYITYEQSDICNHDIILRFLTVDINTINMLNTVTYIKYDEQRGVYSLIVDSLDYTPLFIVTNDNEVF